MIRRLLIHNAIWLFVATSFAASSSLAQNTIDRYIVANAGGVTTSFNHSLIATLGEPIVGPAASANHELCAGFWKAASAIPPTCPGDADGDGAVGLADIAVMINYWAQVVPPFTMGDLTGDGYVGLDDVAIAINYWASSCP